MLAPYLLVNVVAAVGAAPAEIPRPPAGVVVFLSAC